MRIDACYDSHVHWPGTGEFQARLRLNGLSSPTDVESLKPERAHFRGEWLYGFGWDDNNWTTRPHREILDKKFPGHPVVFTRCDAHAVWVNTEVLKRVGLWDASVKDPAGGRVERDADGLPTGVLIDRAADIVKSAIPLPTSLELRRHLLMGVKTYNEAGFTHVRDLTCSEEQWSEAVKLDESGLLTMAVEEYFCIRKESEIGPMLDLIERARRHQTANLRVKGLKLFLDGALGSEGAWISRNYNGRDHAGLRLWQREDLREVLIKSWERNFDVALHAIGDETADWIVNLLVDLKNAGHTGQTHIEHAQLLRPETVTKMKSLAVACHMQPSHWLTDQKWLEQKIGSLMAHAFPWRQLQEAGVPFDFGSDAPIEPASVSRTLEAIRDSAEKGIPRLLGHPSTYMAHGDPAWAPNSFTLFENEIPVQVVFRGEHLI